MKALIIEDEAPISRLLEQTLRKLRPEIEVVGITTDIPESVNSIASNPDLDIIFTDIRIDDGMSFAVFRQVQTDALIVFTTAYDEYALKAFDYNCVDYLLKPVSEESLERALTRCEKRQQRAGLETIASAASDIKSGNVEFRKQLFLTRGLETQICKVDEICYIQTENGIVRVFLLNGEWGDVDLSLSELESSLPQSLFFRTSRQTIIRTDMVGKVTRGPGRDSTVFLKEPYSKSPFKITQERKKALIKRLKG